MKTNNKNQIFSLNNPTTTTTGTSSPTKEPIEKVIYCPKPPPSKTKNQSLSLVSEDNNNIVNEQQPNNLNDEYYDNFLENLIKTEHQESSNKMPKPKKDMKRKSADGFLVQRSQSNKNFINCKFGNAVKIKNQFTNNNNNNHNNNNNMHIHYKNSLTSSNNNNPNNVIYIKRRGSTSGPTASSINNLHSNSISTGRNNQHSSTENKRQSPYHLTSKQPAPLKNAVGSKSGRDCHHQLHKAKQRLSVCDEIHKDDNNNNNKHKNTIPKYDYLISDGLKKDYKLNYQLQKDINNSNSNINQNNQQMLSPLLNDKSKKSKIHKHKTFVTQNISSNIHTKDEVKVTSNEEVKEQSDHKKKRKPLLCCIPFCRK